MHVLLKSRFHRLVECNNLFVGPYIFRKHLYKFTLIAAIQEVLIAAVKIDQCTIF